MNEQFCNVIMSFIALSFSRAPNCFYMFFQRTVFSGLFMWGFFNYIGQILKTFMLILLEETSLTAIMAP